ncbi:hypothetical protein Tco_0747509 [Tanacetum coccineum]|uniref:Uncharacterized protein n=1 Tax=Tanacetum coccineum TaxID=301880 RepID=A0ABQ4YSW8_9ASTR
MFLTLPSSTDSETRQVFLGEADYEEISEGGIPRVIVLGYDGLPLQPVAPPSPDYVLGPENLQILPVPQDEDEREPMFIQAHDPDYVPEPIYPEYIPLEDDHEFPAEEQPLLTIDSLLLTPRIVTESDPEEDPEEYEDERGEEHLAPADSTVIPADEPAFPPEGTELVIPPPSTDITIGLALGLHPSPRISISLPPEAEGERLARYEIGESSTARPVRGQGIDYGFVSTVDAEERRQGIRDVGYGIRDTWVDPAEAVPEIAPMTVGEVNTRVVGLAELHERDTQDLYALLEDAQDGRSRISQRVEMNSQRVDLLMGDRMTLQETVWMVEEEAYASREAWAHSIGLSQATHQELQTHRDHVYAHETYLQAHQTQLQLQSTLIQTQHQVHETRFHMQQTELAALRETDRRRQDQMVETLRVIRDMRREMSDMQAELLALREQRRRARQPGPEARIPDHQEASGDADSHI